MPPLHVGHRPPGGALGSLRGSVVPSRACAHEAETRTVDLLEQLFGCRNRTPPDVVRAPRSADGVSTAAVTIPVCVPLPRLPLAGYD